MKNIGTLSLGFTFAGCFLGAGFVSGQEIWQFFGAFGVSGIFGIILTFLLHFLFGVVLIKLVHSTKITDMDKIVVWKNIPWLRTLVGIVTTFFMFSILIIMSAGAGALLNRMFGLPQFVGCGIFCLVVAVTSMGGVDSMVSALSKLVPFMVVGAIVIGIVSAYRGTLNFDFQTYSENPLLQNWAFSAFTYASHNLFCTIGILAPIALQIDKKTVLPGIGAGSIIMFLIALSVLLGIIGFRDVATSELPMLELAYDTGAVFGICYAVLLLFGMFGTSLSSMVGVMEYLEHKSPLVSKYKKLIIIILSLAGWIFSLFGFGDLIGVVYPISGYFGFAVILAVIIHFVIHKRKKDA